VTTAGAPQVAILRRAPRPGDEPHGAPGDRLRELLDALAREGVDVRLVAFAEEAAPAVREQLLDADAALVFVDPIHVPDGRDRSQLDPLLREVAARGVAVSAHPDTILKLGTKDVLYTTRSLGWGADTHRYTTAEQLRAALPVRLAAGAPRVLKRYRGNGGNGVWKVELLSPVPAGGAPADDARVRVLHALRGSHEEELPLGAFLERCAPYFSGGGLVIDQPFQSRLGKGQLRVYLVRDRVAGFGRQRVAALMPAPPGSPPPEPEPRAYSGPELTDLQALRARMEHEWVPAMQRLLAIETASLPLLWDADFLYGPRTDSGADTHVLCEINVSSVIPFPPEAAAPLAQSTRAWALDARRTRSAAATA